MVTGFPIAVSAIARRLVVMRRSWVAVAELQVVPSLRDVRVFEERVIAAFNHLKTGWRPDKVELVYAAVRDR
ncbi:hypothetical protein RB199_28125 [Streptomyces libani]